ncbi:MAG: tetratricopeptide repeat protein [Elusimicrobia bacterium]|nr:tetratricopeptide repeat protein [Elusimicrobiota bacterium]
MSAQTRALLKQLSRTESPDRGGDLSAARLAERRGRFAEAERLYSRAAAAAPADRDIHMDFARFLEARGRFREAAARAARALRLGGPRAELLMSLGRLSEKQGRLRKAEDCYRRSAQAAPELDQPAWEAARILERLGRRRDAARWYRRLGRPGGALAGRARLALAWLSWDEGRVSEAEKGFQRAAAAAEGALPDWPRIFSALLCARRYRSAFRLGEEMLRRSVELSNSNCFQWPWWYARAAMGRAEQERFAAEELRRLSRAAKAGGFAHWFAYCRGPLLSGRREFDAAYARIRRLPARYSCLHHPFVLRLLNWSDYGGVIAACRRVSRLIPGYWGFRCREAEACLMKGETARGLRLFESLQESVAASAKPAVMTWHGEARLWLGDYRKAAALLDEALSLGAPEWALGWRGAARLKLGDARGALADLDRALQLRGEDDEARVWRAEALRRKGRDSEALRDLDLVLRHDPGNVWARIDRALVRLSLGDERGLAEDLDAVPARVRAVIEKRLGSAAPVPGAARLAAVLEAILEGAKGVRRPESYLEPLWLR